jgi:myo-inositol 2-dehydrogenase/D-chiro-inositol 1-dehydrogenase
MFVKFSPTRGGLVMDILTHNYDCACWFVNSESKSVSGLGSAYLYAGLRAINDTDHCSIPVEFDNGVVDQLETSRSFYGYHIEKEIYGSDGCIRIGTVAAKDRVAYVNTTGVYQEGAEWSFECWEPAFCAEMQDFVDCMLDGREPLLGLGDGYSFPDLYLLGRFKTVDLALKDRGGSTVGLSRAWNVSATFSRRHT